MLIQHNYLSKNNYKLIYKWQNWDDKLCNIVNKQID